MKRRLALGLAVAAVALTILVVSVGWQDVLDAMRDADRTIFSLAFLAVIGTLAFRTLSWHQVLQSVERAVPRRQLFGIFTSATFMKYATPYGQVAATPAIAYVLSQNTGGEFEGDFAAVVSGDFINYVPYYTLGTFGLLYLIFGTAWTFDVTARFYLVPLIFLAILAGFLFIWYRRETVERALLSVADWSRRVVARVSPRVAEALSKENLQDRLQGFYSTLDLLATDRRSILLALFFGHLGWIMLAVALYVTLYAIGSPIAFPLAMLAVALSKLGFLVPAPGGLGGVEATLAAVLVLTAGIGVAAATAGALLFRLAAYWFPFALGGIWTAVLSLRGFQSNRN
ncbi:flippase-like domain-containing protein [Salinarchaeum sp. IM2453]|uniref:lysylphosphatidylglycerol synthase transmembrane domain-containing protein n=1 Tax=Salinarchaeum sp. IM2453 TaxID=2862870 RepID=UPI001C8352FE|nr:flippase-like domain-containing protein [Salinarchaeum sp. IM2453]QZA87741.1 flippase-like domain-containing protein [Salinarchaeum sp. IM2453]